MSKDDIGQDASGVHCDDTGQPMALITSDLDWSVTASHEVLEMLVDPFGNRTIAGQSVSPDQGRVEYLVEVSDPVAAGRESGKMRESARFVPWRRFYFVLIRGGRPRCDGGRTRSRPPLFGR